MIIIVTMVRCVGIKFNVFENVSIRYWHLRLKNIGCSLAKKSVRPQCVSRLDSTIAIFPDFLHRMFAHSPAPWPYDIANSLVHGQQFNYIYNKTEQRNWGLVPLTKSIEIVTTEISQQPSHGSGVPGGLGKVGWGKRPPVTWTHWISLVTHCTTSIASLH